MDPSIRVPESDDCRYRRHMRWLLCVGVWLVANLAGLFVAAETTWGPVVARLSTRHGVHLGDVLAVLVGVAVAATVTGLLWATSPSHPATPVVVRWVLVAAVWQITMVAAIFLAASTDWGPVVMRLWQQKPMHLGALFTVLVGVAFATMVTGLVWAISSSHPSAQVGPTAQVSTAGG